MSEPSDELIRQQLEVWLPKILRLLELEGLAVEILGVDHGIAAIRLNGSCNG
ncbi:MAG: hypothetical protein SNJ75_13010 [Gemmataceae bacterium]